MADRQRSRANIQVTSILALLLTVPVQFTTAAPFGPDFRANGQPGIGGPGSGGRLNGQRPDPGVLSYFSHRFDGHSDFSHPGFPFSTDCTDASAFAAVVTSTSDIVEVPETAAAANPVTNTSPAIVNSAAPSTLPVDASAVPTAAQTPAPASAAASTQATNQIAQTLTPAAAPTQAISSVATAFPTFNPSTLPVADPTVALSAAPSAAPSSSIEPASSSAAGSIVQTQPGVFAETSNGVVIFITRPVTIQTNAASVASLSLTPSSKGTILSSLRTSLVSSVQPFPTTVISSTVATLSSRPIPSSSAAPSLAPVANNIFVPIASDAPPPQIVARSDYPLPRVGVPAQESTPLGTNKFYANLMTGSQKMPVWTQPYQLSWSDGKGNPASYGMSLTHVDASQYSFGPGNPPSYYVNPIGVQSLVLSAAELGSSTIMSTTDHRGQSVNVNFAPSGQQANIMTMPLVQGMGLVTAIYSGATPQVQSGILFKSLSALTPVSGSTYRTIAVLQDGTTWLIYITPTTGAPTKRDGSLAAPVFVLNADTTLQGPKNWSGLVQVAKLSANGQGQSAYDSSAGAYATAITVTGALGTSYALSVTGTIQGSYSLTFVKAGDTSKTLVMFALPHHYQAFDANTSKNTVSGATLQSSTKGMAELVQSDSWTMNEALPASMGFAPWSPTFPGVTSLSSAAVPVVSSAAAAELSEDISAQTNLDSMYFSGKALAKFAAILYTAHDLANAGGIAGAGLIKLKAALDVFVQNKQIHPLNYDSVWKGVVSSAGYGAGNLGADFGNTVYNDHHFHYSYFVYTAAVIAYLDPTWLNQGTNKAWVNMLVRDYANSVEGDPYYPFSRNFDWYHGHSWAHGITESGAGKGTYSQRKSEPQHCSLAKAHQLTRSFPSLTDQESSSEDSFASYALKMWGKVIGDSNMEARGNLMLAIQARSFADYYQMETSNTVEPANYLPNKASGILFEGKIDHTTYFGTNIEYIEG